MKEMAADEITALAAGAGPPANKMATRFIGLAVFFGAGQSIGSHGETLIKK
jgi:hypothetical protein